jgi:ComF family protein
MLLKPSPAPITSFRRLVAAGLDLVFPPACAGCGRLGHVICPACAQRVEPTPSTICQQCGRVQPVAVAQCAQCAGERGRPLQRVRAAGLHVAPLREFIHKLKYEQRPDLAAPLSRYLVATLAGPDWNDLRTLFHAALPVPLHPDRIKERGYNQSELLAAGLCERTGLPLRVDLMQRTRSTRSQVGLNVVERRDNVAGAFVASPACAGRNLLLIDDVYTTGATLTACAQAARAAGALLVCGLTLAIPSQSSP